MFCMNYLRNTIVPTSMSKLARTMALKDINMLTVMKARKDNYETLFDDIKRIHPSLLRYTVKQKYPLCFPIYMNNRDRVQSKLAAKGVYCQVLWPIPTDAGATCMFSRDYSEHMLAIPCDQRYSKSDMSTISNILQEIIFEDILE